MRYGTVLDRYRIGTGTGTVTCTGMFVYPVYAKRVKLIEGATRVVHMLPVSAFGTVLTFLRAYLGTVGTIDSYLTLFNTV